MFLADGIQIQAAELKDIADWLVEGKGDLDTRPLKDVDLAPTAFGGTERGASLHFHHERARWVMHETLEGLSEDVSAFARALEDLGRVVEDLDLEVRADMDARTAAVNALVATQHTSAADQRYDEARNDVTGGQAG